MFVYSIRSISFPLNLLFLVANDQSDPHSTNQTFELVLDRGTRYIVVDCGGGTVDITVHELDTKMGTLKELYKATGGPYGSVGRFDCQSLISSLSRLQVSIKNLKN